MTIPGFKKDGERSRCPKQLGTLAIDLGSTTTVLAFQAQSSTDLQMVNLGLIGRAPGQVPSILWCRSAKDPALLLGQQVIDAGQDSSDDPRLVRDFKRWIGRDALANWRCCLTPEEAGELLLGGIWQQLPEYLEVQRLVITAPIEHYRHYKSWLQNACGILPVAEIALIDEPTAAALGAGLPCGAKLLVVDLGGSTLDLALVHLEGGEGRPAPIAQLMRFRGQDLSGKSCQTLRCAKVLGKAGMQLGGRDLDCWIADTLLPNDSRAPAILAAAERLKCRLSSAELDPDQILTEMVGNYSLQLSQRQLEDLLTRCGFFKSLETLLEKTLAGGRQYGCSLRDLQGVVAVGGGAQIPLLQRWLSKHTSPAPLLTPPPVEAVVRGALQLTPAVQIRDVLHRGVSLRYWDQRSNRHNWHPLFLAGQHWPTTSPLELTLAASQNNQSSIELVLGEPRSQSLQEIIFINGLPRLSQESETSDNDPMPEPWSGDTPVISLSPLGQPAEDVVRLRFWIDGVGKLMCNGEDLRTGQQLEELDLGPIR